MDAPGEADDLGPILFDKILRMSQFVAQAFDLLPSLLDSTGAGEAQGSKRSFVGHEDCGFVAQLKTIDKLAVVLSTQALGMEFPGLAYSLLGQDCGP